MPNLATGLRKPFLQCVLLLICGFILTGCAVSTQSSREIEPAAVLNAEQMALNLESFDIIWETIRDKHYDVTLGGLDWQAIGDQHRSLVSSATTMLDARLAMQEMILTLEQSHFVIYPADVYDDAAATEKLASDSEDTGRKLSHSGIPGHSGLSLRVLDGHVLVTHVDDDTPAAELGLVPGWELLTIDKIDLASRVEKISEVLEGEPMLGLILSRSMEARLAGDTEDTILVTCLDADQKKVTIELVLGPARGHIFAMGNLPPVRVWTQQDVLPGNIGYFHFNYFLDVMTVMRDYNKAMTSFMDLPAVIIDLRGNPGGLGAMAMGMAGWFVQERGLRLGTMTMRTGEMNFVINTRANGYQGKVALLIDDLSASTSEIMAGGMKDLNLARVFGMRTAGAALPSNIIKLPNGDGFQFAIANYISEGGEVLEGVGVAPDVEIIPTRESLLTVGDPILDAARKWLLQTENTEE